ncbi:MAG: hypothetical protein R3B40_22225 [Polyangiales bacterium]|nr:hypothetical protein [Myxococcales bacterium]MCB9656825.1 hypothetical protein [Sandaracinaceae bacterium]
MRLALGLALATLLALPAAQASANTPAPTEITFTDADLVRGELVRSEGEIIQVRGRLGTSRLIRPRVNFVPELLKDAENI